MKALTELILEIQTQAFVDELQRAGGPPIYKLTPPEARAVLEKLQSTSIEKPRVTTEDKLLPVGPKGQVSIRIIRPFNNQQKLPIVLYIHGAGWVMGSATTHEHLVNSIANGAQAAVIFVNYPLSPEAKFPTAIEEAYATIKYLAEHGQEFNLDTNRLVIAGDSVGGNMAIAVTLLAKERRGPKINAQVLFYPVTSSEMNTNSYDRFTDGPWLTKPAMEWFWNAYESNAASRKNLLLSPLNATIDQLKGLPSALIITAENDVLRDEGEEYARKLMQAGVKVTAARFLGTIHDFVMLNALAKTSPTQNAIAFANLFIRQAFE